MQSVEPLTRRRTAAERIADEPGVFLAERIALTLPLLVVASAVVTSVVATSVIHRLEPTELLRDE